MRFRVALFVFCCLLHVAKSCAAEKSARALYDQINALRVDASSVYEIEPAHPIELRRADVKFSFENGKIAFLQAFDNRVTGLVFLGYGHILASPRDPVEKQQVARFVGTPVLDQNFTSACL